MYQLFNEDLRRDLFEIKMLKSKSMHKILHEMSPVRYLSMMDFTGPEAWSRYLNVW